MHEWNFHKISMTQENLCLQGDRVSRSMYAVGHLVKIHSVGVFMY